MDETEKLGDFIYAELKKIEIEFDTKIVERSLITFELSDRLIKAGYSPHLVEPAQFEVLSDEEIRLNCIGKSNYFIGELGLAATDPVAIFMPMFRNVSQATADKIKKDMLEIINTYKTSELCISADVQKSIEAYFNKD